jgi:hypothetical protein
MTFKEFTIEEALRGQYAFRAGGEVHAGLSMGNYIQQATDAVKGLYPSSRRIQLIGGTPEEGKLEFEVDIARHDIGVMRVIMTFKKSERSTDIGRWIETGKY